MPRPRKAPKTRAEREAEQLRVLDEIDSVFEDAPSSHEHLRMLLVTMLDDEFGSASKVVTPHLKMQNDRRQRIAKIAEREAKLHDELHSLMGTMTSGLGLATRGMVGRPRPGQKGARSVRGELTGDTSCGLADECQSMIAVVREHAAFCRALRAFVARWQGVPTAIESELNRLIPKRYHDAGGIAAFFREQLGCQYRDVAIYYWWYASPGGKTTPATESFLEKKAAAFREAVRLRKARQKITGPT